MRMSPAIAVATVSLLVLFLELALIRWLPSQVRVLAYFPNLVLLSAFLGLGVGALRSSAKSVAQLFMPMLAVVALVAALGSRIAFSQDRSSEYLRLLYFDLPADAPSLRNVHVPIVVAFVLCALLFAPLGQLLAQRIDTFRASGRTLVGYAWDIAGSLVGVVAFAALSFSGAPPIAWFGVVVALALLTMQERRERIIVAIASVPVLAVVVLTHRADVMSPYYAISVREEPGHELHVLTNGSLHQVALDLRRTGPSTQRIDEIRAGYHAPYQKLGRPIRKALVLGAGSGNDVAVLLDEGAQHVDAVEIDPMILRIGRERHPARPYSDPRVTAHNTDARAFLQRAAPGYDVIVFGTLDSMTQTSALANVRLDNFVYTRESIEAARRLLTADGALILFFMSGARYVDEHMYTMVTAAFEHEPLVQTEHRHLFNRVFMTGPAFVDATTAPRVVVPDDAVYPHDDWPYLYLAERGISAFYLSTMLILALIAALLIAAASRAMLQKQNVDLEMFFLGAAFLLVEAKLITSMSLVWGATWLTSSVVFGAVLATVLVATLVAARKPLDWRVAFAGMVVTLLLTWLVPHDALVGHPIALRLVLSILYAGVPLFFASSLFGVLFAKRADATVALGWNLLGAVLGGLLELSGMLTGHRATTLLAVALALAFGFIAVRRRV